MKKLVCLVALIASSAFSNTNQIECYPGEVKAFFYKENPTQKIGPNYTCSRVLRLRECIEGSWSSETPACEDYDSGGCVDSWISQLNDSQFTFESCRD